MAQPKLELEAYAGAILGARRRQEDASRIWQSSGEDGGRGAELVLLVADGLGGHVSGDVASSVVCDAFLSAVETARGGATDRLQQALARGHDALRNKIDALPGSEGMGTTLLAVHVDERGLSWLSVGDTMLLHYSNGRLQRLNDDHSLGSALDKQAEAGIITASEASANPKRNALRSAVASGPIALVDVSKAPLPLAAGDWVLLASDGLLTLRQPEIEKLVRAHAATDAKALVGALLDAVEARKQAGQDNTTIVALAAHPGPATRLVTPARSEGSATVRAVARSGHGAAIAGLLAMAAIAAIGGYYWLTRGVAPAPPATESAPTEAKQPPPEGKAKPDSLKPTEPPPAVPTPKVQP